MIAPSLISGSRECLSRSSCLGVGDIVRPQCQEVSSHLTLEVVRGVEGNDLAMVDDGDAVAVLSLVHVVGREEDGEVLLTAEIANILPDAVAGLRIESQRRLVEEQHSREMYEAPCDLKPSFHSTGVRTDVALATVPESHQGKKRLRTLLADLLRNAVGQGVKHDVLLGRQVVVESRVLEDESDGAPDIVLLTDDVVTVDGGSAPARLEERAEHVDCGGLARAVRTQKAEDLAHLHLERHALYGFDLSVALGEVLYRDHRHGEVLRGKKCVGR